MRKTVRAYIYILYYILYREGERHRERYGKLSRFGKTARNHKCCSLATSENLKTVADCKVLPAPEPRDIAIRSSILYVWMNSNYSV